MKKQNLYNYNPERIEESIDTIISENNIDGTVYYCTPSKCNWKPSLGTCFKFNNSGVLIKYNSLIGLNVRTPGTDHAGIATQLVEKALNNEGVDSSKLSNEQLIEKIWDWKQKNGNKILEQLLTVAIGPK